MTDTLGGNAKEQLKAYIERVEALEEEKKALADDIKDIFAEAKDHKFDVAALKAIIRRRKDPEKAAALEDVIDGYLRTLEWDTTPLGRAPSEARTH